MATFTRSFTRKYGKLRKLLRKYKSGGFFYTPLYISVLTQLSWMINLEYTCLVNDLILCVQEVVTHFI